MKKHIIVENYLVVGELSYQTDNTIEVGADVDVGDVYVNGKVYKLNFPVDENTFKDLKPEEVKAKIKELEEQEKLKAIYDSCRNYIYQYYPIDKQASDQADKEYYTTLLKAKGIDNLEAVVVAKVQDFFNDVPLENLVDDVVDEDKEAYIQLIKVGIRVTWVQMCKQELKLAITENREPKFPEYPL